MSCFFFFFNDTATTEIYTLSLHDALPISAHDETQDRHTAEDHCNEKGDRHRPGVDQAAVGQGQNRGQDGGQERDRKSTRLNSSHANISYAVFCLKKKKQKRTTNRQTNSNN